MQGGIREPLSPVATLPHLAVSDPNEAEKTGRSVIYEKKGGQGHFFKLKFIPQ